MLMNGPCWSITAQPGGTVPKPVTAAPVAQVLAVFSTMFVLVGFVVL